MPTLCAHSPGGSRSDAPRRYRHIHGHRRGTAHPHPPPPARTSSTSASTRVYSRPPCGARWRCRVAAACRAASSSSAARLFLLHRPRHLMGGRIRCWRNSPVPITGCTTCTTCTISGGGGFLEGRSGALFSSANVSVQAACFQCKSKQYHIT